MQSDKCVIYVSHKLFVEKEALRITKKKRRAMIGLKNKTSVFNIKNCVRHKCLIKPFCQGDKNTLAYYGTGGPVTVGMNYLASSCSDDPECHLCLSVRQKCTKQR